MRKKQTGECLGPLIRSSNSPDSHSVSGNPRLRNAFAGLFAISLATFILSSCGAPSNSPEGQPKEMQKGEQKNDQSADLGSDDDFGGADSITDAKGKKAAPAKPKPQVSTHGKKTGKLIDSLLIQQQNEFLGSTTVKLSNKGARLESTLLTIIMPPGGLPVAYNSQNGATMQLTENSAAIMSGRSPQSTGKLETKVEKLGTDKVAGVKCNHFYVQKYAIDKKTKKRDRVWYADVWATKDLDVSPAVLKACSRIMVIPPELGFPMRITRNGVTTMKEQAQGARASRQRRDVIVSKSVEHKKIDQGEFEKLEGFTPVKNEMELMMNENDSDLAGSDLDDMDPVR